MADSHHFQVRLRRVLLEGIDVHDRDDVREVLLDELRRTVVARCGYPDVIRYLSDGLLEEADVGEVATQTGAPELAAFFRRARARPGVVRSFRAGELAVARGGEPARAVGVLEWMESDRWWVAWRHFVPGAEGTGRFEGDWQELEGQGLGTLNRAFVPWIDARDREVGGMDASWAPTRVPHPDVRAAVVPLPAPVPHSAEALLAAIAADVDGQVMRHGIEGLVVLAFREASLERWEIRGELPCGLDDLVRAVCAQEPTQAVAVIYEGRIEIEGTVQRAAVTLAECRGDRALRVLTFTGEDGARVPGTPASRSLGDPGDRGWVGVRPTAEVRLTAVAPVGVPLREVPEG